MKISNHITWLSFFVGYLKVALYLKFIKSTHYVIKDKFKNLIEPNKPITSNHQLLQLVSNFK